MILEKSTPTATITLGLLYFCSNCVAQSQHVTQASILG